MAEGFHALRFQFYPCSTSAPISPSALAYGPPLICGVFVPGSRHSASPLYRTGQSLGGATALPSGVETFSVRQLPQSVSVLPPFDFYEDFEAATTVVDVVGVDQQIKRAGTSLMFATRESISRKRRGIDITDLKK